jgi:hypothetical protein
MESNSIIEIKGLKGELPAEVQTAIEDFSVACAMNFLNLVAIEFDQPDEE